jgi:hypothetical protein
LGLPGRPLSATILLCASHLPHTLADPNVAYRIDTLVHELLHGLYFFNAHFPYFRDGFTPEDSSHLVSSVNVLAEAAKHFGCPINSINGVPLEESGSSGTAGSHWGSLALEGDIMANVFPGVGQRRRVVSAITLAFAEDSGWFVSNYTEAGFLRRGFRQGCGLLQRVRASN